MLINQNDEYGDDDEDNYEDNVDWYTSDDGDELEESAHTVGPRPDGPELVDHFDGNLEDADASASQLYASDSKSQFHSQKKKETRELLPHVKSAKGYSPLVGIGASETCQVSRQEQQEERKDFSVQGWKVSISSYTWSLAKKLPSRSEPPPPMCKKPTETGKARGPPHAPRLPSCFAKNERRLACHLTNVHLVRVLLVVLYSTM